MSAIYKIREGMNNFTETEKRIGKYILENKESVIEDSAQELAERIDTSPATIVRFSRKIGYKGYTALKLSLAKDDEAPYVDFNDIIKDSDSIEVLMQKSKQSNINTLEQTFKLINHHVLKDAIYELTKCNKIYLFGVGASGLVALDLHYKLSRIKKMSICNMDPHIQLAAAANMEREDVAIGISYSGETKEVLTSLKVAKENGAKTICITKYCNNALSKVADYVFYVPDEEKELRIGAISSRISTLAIIDLLYLGVAKDDLEETQKYILQTRKIIEKIQ